MKAHRFLENVRVIDLSQYIPGPFATRQLADLGAEVMKSVTPGQMVIKVINAGGPSGFCLSLVGEENRWKENRRTRYCGDESRSG